MNISRKSFQAAFDKAAPMAGKRTSLPIISCIRLEAINGQLEIAATDLDCFATIKCECEGSLQPICVSANIIGGLIKSAGESITLELKKNGRLSIVGNGSADIATQPADEFPAFPAKKAKEIGLSIADLAECIDAVAWAADPKNQNQVMKTVVWVKSEPKALTCAATSGYQLAHIKRDLISADCEFMFPAIHASFLVEALQSKDATLALSESYVIAKSESYCVAVRRVEGNYFNLGTVLNQTKNPIGEINPYLFLPAISTVQGLAVSDPFCATSIEFKSDGARIKYEGSTNQYQTTIPCEAKSSVAFKVDGAKASAFFKHIKSDKAQAAIGETNNLFLTAGERVSVLQLLTEKK